MAENQHLPGDTRTLTDNLKRSFVKQRRKTAHFKSKTFQPKETA